MSEKIEYIINKTIHYLGVICSILLILLLINVFYDVIMRYVFNDSSIALQELEWHLFSVIVLFGMSYTLKEDAHVRVDIFYEKLTLRKQALINIIGALFFIIPFSLFVIIGSESYAMDSYAMGEISPDPGGLAYRFVIKSSIFISFGLLLLASLGFILRNITILLDKKSEKHHEDRKVF